ncbi:MAG: ATP phosphoribosyltransferase [Deltaproteobacteria bacterium]|nr:ATP phosphoribosyltransferase [Deltaproteobacteria bacterium]
MGRAARAARGAPGRGPAPVTLALPKGRILEEALALFARAGYDLRALHRPGRRLIFDLPEDGLRVILVKDLDVPTYLDYGAADAGIAGRDVIEEQGFDLYEPLDLGLGRCRLVLAEPIDRPVDERAAIHLRIATKYPQLTRRWLDERGQSAEVIKLFGSIELAPAAGLCDRLVDLVQTGETLRQHRLREVTTLLAVTARLVVNRASLKLKAGPLSDLVRRLAAAVAAPASARRPAACATPRPWCASG